PDLFWALQGGGGNFGVVTSFEFALHAVPTIEVAIRVYDANEARSVLPQYAGWAPDAARHVTTLAGLSIADNDPMFPPELVGRPVMLVAAFSCGDTNEASEAFAEIDAMGDAAVAMTMTVTY